MIATGDGEPGSFDKHGDPAPIPIDCHEWRYATYSTIVLTDGEPPF